MEKKQFRGEYLAPRVKVVEMQARQQMLAGSPVDVRNAFDGGEEEDWSN